MALMHQALINALCSEKMIYTFFKYVHDINNKIKFILCEVKAEKDIELDWSYVLESNFCIKNFL